MRKPFLLTLIVLLAAGCVERKMTVTSDPPGALLYLDGHEKGVTPVTFKFDHYGRRCFRLQHDGCEITEEIRTISPPPHLVFPLDMIPDLTPIPASDRKTLHFTLSPLQEVDKSALKERASEFRDRALVGKSGRGPKEVEPSPIPETAPSTPTDVPTDQPAAQPAP